VAAPDAALDAERRFVGPEIEEFLRCARLQRWGFEQWLRRRSELAEHRRLSREMLRRATTRAAWRAVALALGAWWRRAVAAMAVREMQKDAREMDEERAARAAAATLLQAAARRRSVSSSIRVACARSEASSSDVEGDGGGAARLLPPGLEPFARAVDACTRPPPTPLPPEPLLTPSSPAPPPPSPCSPEPPLRPMPPSPPSPPSPVSVEGVRGLDVCAPPFVPGAAYAGAAYAGAAMAVGLVRAELHALTRVWRAPAQPRRTGGRQRRAARLRGRRWPACYVGPAQAAQRFGERAAAHGWLTDAGSDTEYYSAEDGD